MSYDMIFGISADIYYNTSPKMIENEYYFSMKTKQFPRFHAFVTETLSG